jgi:hypothetical protein
MENNNEAAPGKARQKAPPWQKGQSGNPHGSKVGSKHKATLFAQALFDGECEELIRKVIALAKAGDIGALQICVDHLVPPVKSRPIQFKLPPLRSVSDALSAMTLIIDGAARGEILRDEAQALSELVGNFIRAVEVNELESRLAALEKARDEDRASLGARYDA